MKLDGLRILPQPFPAFYRQPMGRGVVYDQEDLSTRVNRDQLLEEAKKCRSVEHLGETEVECRGVEVHGAKHVSRLALSVRINTRLLANRGPRAVESAIQPKACLVLEKHYATTLSGFFFMVGNRLRSQICCFSWSARANRLRGRWTEKPRAWSNFGM